MSSQNSRQGSRRKTERRKKDQRVITHEFGSPEWILEVKKSYTFWPKEDRRKSERRGEDRRTLDRRSELRVGRTSAKLQAQKGTYVLTDEEKEMLNDLMGE